MSCNQSIIRVLTLEQLCVYLPHSSIHKISSQSGRVWSVACVCSDSERSL